MTPHSLGRECTLVAPRRLELRRVTVAEPGAAELVIRVGAATTCGTDVKVFHRGGHPRMLQPPCPFGHEMAGTVIATGPDQRQFREGDRVVVANSCSCGDCSRVGQDARTCVATSSFLNGGFADYLLVPSDFAQRRTLALPDDMPFEIACLAEPLACALHAGDVVEGLLGQRPPLSSSPAAVVLGSGPMGLLLVRVLSSIGLRVVAADPNPQRLELARAFGAERSQLVVKDGADSERLRRLMKRSEGFAVAIDATGTPEGWLTALRSVQTGGLAVFFGGCAVGTTLAVDTEELHYSELMLTGVFHHRPASFSAALETLAASHAPYDLLLNERRGLEELELALERMSTRHALKAIIDPQL